MAKQAEAFSKGAGLRHHADVSAGPRVAAALEDAHLPPALAEEVRKERAAEAERAIERIIMLRWGRRKQSTFPTPIIMRTRLISRILLTIL